MLTWRRRSMHAILPALLAYLVMSGIDSLHLHVIADAPDTTAHMLTLPASMPAGETCLVCVWHALATSCLATDMAFLVLPVALPTADRLTVLSPPNISDAPRSRGPPE